MLLERLQRLLPRRYDATAEDFELRGCALYCAGLVEVEGAEVLDVGGSIGWFAREALARGAARVTGVDPSAEALDVARRTAPDARFVVGSGLDLPFPDATFDVVTMFNVIEHVPRGTERTLLSEGARVLRPGGRLGLVTPRRHYLPTLLDPAWYLGHRHYTESHVASLLRAAGLDVQRVETPGGAFDTLDLLLYYASRHLLRRERHPFPRVRARADREFAPGFKGRNYVAVVAQLTYNFEHGRP